MASVEVVTAPTTGEIDELLSLEDFKVARSVFNEDDDEFLQICIYSAYSFAEEELELAILPQTLQLTLDSFPDCNKYRPDRIRLERAFNLISVDSITYLDTNGEGQVLSTDIYKALATHPGAVALKDGKSWPSTAAERGSVVIEYQAGWDTAAVPRALKHAIIMAGGDLDLQRENSWAHPGGIQVIEVPIGFKRLTSRWNLRG